MNIFLLLLFAFTGMASIVRLFATNGKKGYVLMGLSVLIFILFIVAAVWSIG